VEEYEDAESPVIEGGKDPGGGGPSGDNLGSSPDGGNGNCERDVAVTGVPLCENTAVPGVAAVGVMPLSADRGVTLSGRVEEGEIALDGPDPEPELELGGTGVEDGTLS
jgi:hypothetical protein